MKHSIDKSASCYVGCSAVKNKRAELHAWLQYKGDVCDAATMEQQLAPNGTSCHGRHYDVHVHYFVLRAEYAYYDDHALVFICSKTYGHRISAALWSRFKSGASAEVRDKMNALLRKNGWTRKLEKETNTDCDD